MGRWRAPPACTCILPVEFRADLSNTRIARVGDDSEARVVDVSGRILKLRVVEDIEKFDTDIESEILFNLCPLQYSEIGVVESGAVEEAPVGSAKSSENAVLYECPAGWDTRIQSRVRARQRRDKETSGDCRAIGIRVTRIQSMDLTDQIRHIRGRTTSE